VPFEFLSAAGALIEKLAAATAAHFLLRATELRYEKRGPQPLGPLVTKLHAALGEWLMPALLRSLPPEAADRLLSTEVLGRRRLFPVASLLETDGNGGTLSPSITISRDLSSQVDDRAVNEALVSHLRQLGIVVTDDPVFRLLDVSADNTLHFGLSSYERVLSSCDVHYYNLLQVLPSKASEFRRTFFLRRKLTRKWLKAVSDMLLQHRFPAFSAGTGCSTLLVLNAAEPRQPDRYQYTIVTQSPRKNGVNERHVVPAFMLQPSCRTPDEFHLELDVQLQVLREFSEELLGEELGHNVGVDALREDIDRNPACKALRLRLLDGRASLHITGLWLDIFRLRPEITCLLLVRDPEYFRGLSRRLKWNFESERFKHYSLDDDKGYHVLLSDAQQRLCPPGAAALIQGRALARRLLQKGAKSASRG
jgi:hypothetical protein